MRRAVLFLSRSLITVSLVLVGAFLLLLLPNAPSVPNTPFASVAIRTEHTVIHLPNRIFACTETAQQFQCQAEIQGGLLKLTLTKEEYYKYDLKDCRASYEGRSVGCQEKGLNYAPMLSEMYEITNLGLNPQQLKAVEQEHWGRNTLVQLGEVRLLWISTGLALAIGISAAFFSWLHPGNLSKGFVSFACGFGMFRLIGGQLGQVQFEIMTPYGFTPDTWNWAVSVSAIVAGISTMVATALLLWRRLNRLTKILLSISSSAGIFSLCWWSLSWNSNYVLSFFGLADAFFQHSYLLMSLFSTISVLLAIVAAVLLWLHTNQSIKRFLCLGCGVGAIALATSLLLSMLLGLGYVD
ncbi:hypothetical protein IFO70_19855 [Phormidium tenue FACHB-886]|nr:hypothetical protein [Phormidium tenue FACHB-886]